MRCFLFALLAIFLLSGTVVAEGPSKEFKSEGFSWKLPSDEWSFLPTSPEMRRAGFVAQARCSAASIEVWAYAKGSEGLPMADRVRELAHQGGEGLGSPVATKVMDTTLSGIKGKVVIQKIKAEGGTEGHFRKYVILTKGKFYQLLFRCWHGAHMSMTDEINAVRKGFRLLKGAGAEDEDEELDEVEGSDDGSGGGVSGVDDDWPENGPEKEGRKIKIHNRNIEWELPSDSPFKWAGATENVKQEGGQFAFAMAKVKRKKQEFEKDTPDFNFCRLDLLIQKANAGFKPDSWMRSGNAQKTVEENWKLLEDINSGKTRTKDKVKVGNHHGAYIKLAGKVKDGDMTLMMFSTVLRGDLYFIWGRCWGYKDAYKQLAPLVGKALSGIRFLETKEPVRGPLLGMIPDAAGKRGEYADIEKRVTGAGYIFMKPVGLCKIKAGDAMNKDLQFVGEGRSEDEENYIYFEIRRVKLNQPRIANPDPEKFIEKRAQDWEAGAGDEAHLGSKRGLKIKKGKFGLAKGFTYKFTGHLGKVPFVEEGWVVKFKSNLLWFKLQYGGQDGEAKMKKFASKIRKAVKFKK